jgi:sulfonate transport system permease protein
VILPGRERAAVGWALLGLALFLGAWAAVAWRMSQPHVLPDPLTVARTVLERRFDLADAALRSGLRVGAGWAAAAALAVPLGWVSGSVPSLDGELRRFTALVRAIPPFAWLPLLLLWVGIGETTSMLVCALGAFFPILEGARVGASEAPTALLNAARNLGASPVRVLFRVRIPAALPSTFTGLRTGATFAWLSVVAAELVGADGGLGQLVLDARNLARPDLAIAGMLCIGAVASATAWGLGWVERRAQARGLA